MNTTTEAFQSYRLCARLVWNLFFKPSRDLADWDGREEFDRIRELLFDTLVLRKLGLTAGSAFAVIPRLESGVPVKIEKPRTGDQNHYWDHPLTEIRPRDARLLFIDYFDWNPIGYLDFTYVRVKILEFSLHTELVGREALLEVDHIEILPADDRSL